MSAASVRESIARQSPGRHALPVESPGASREALALHYDTGNEFFRLWLDETMSYSCACWDEHGAPESLLAAQERKIDFHIHQARASGAERVLDVGCGWGGLLRRLVEKHGVRHAIGLTLSPAQAEWIAAHPRPGLEALQETWAEHVPEAPYDAVISVEAFEAFARLGLTAEQKLRAYRTFFRRCRAWLKPGGRLSLQTIAYGSADARRFDRFIATEIFPEQDLPHLNEITAASERLFEIVLLQNDRGGYTRTLRSWLERLKGQLAEAVRLVGETTVVRFERYLRLSIFMFESGACDLYRMVFRRLEGMSSGS
jgi:cyclopropane-fatty-acyl-phospholipid synthase